MKDLHCAFIALAMVSTACGGSDLLEGEEEHRQVKLQFDSLELKVGQWRDLGLSFSGFGRSDIVVRATDPRIASVEGEIVTGSVAGRTWVSAGTRDGSVADSTLVIVTNANPIDMRVIHLPDDTIRLDVGRWRDVGLTFSGLARSDIHLSVSDTTVAGIGGDSVTGRAPGTTWVVATTRDELIRDSSMVVVSNSPPQSVCAVIVVPSDIRLYIGEVVQLGAARTQVCGTSDKPVFRSRDGDVVDVSETGLVTAKGLGHTTVRVWFFPDSTMYADARIEVIG